VGASLVLVLEGRTSREFGLGLSERRREFVLHALRHHLRRPALPPATGAYRPT
jgi:hypothetical protein